MVRVQMRIVMIGGCSFEMVQSKVVWKPRFCCPGVKQSF